MTYQRMLNPRFYMDNVNWLASRGASRDSTFALNAGAGFDPLNSGYTKFQLFDNNPGNFVTFDTSSGTDTVSIKIDLGMAGISCNFISILNHNLNTAGGSIRVAHSTSAITTVGGGTESTVGTAYLNAAIGGGTVVEPAADGDTLYTFTSSTDRYWVVEFSDIATWSATDLQVGEIVLGKYWTASLAPDMSTGRATGFNGVTLQEAYGGKRFGFAGWVTASSNDYSPFRVGSSKLSAGGRASYDFSYSYLADTEIYPSDMATPYGSANFLADVVNKSSMGLNPFIFAVDSTSTTAGDYMFARFDGDTFSTSRPTANVETFSARIDQEF